MAVCPIGMTLSIFSPAFCFPRSQNFTNLPDSWICGRFAGNFGRSAFIIIYMPWCSGYGLVCPWAQPGCKACSVIFKMSLVVIVWPPGSKTRQTSRIRRDSENWVIVGHTPKLPKIIDRRNVQVYPTNHIFIYRRVGGFCWSWPLWG